MTLSIPVGIQISVDNINWYKISDHNRSPIGISYDIVEQSQRMANGTMRKYVIAKKLKVSTDWKDFPTLDSNVVDAGTNVVAAAWIKAFYEGNVFAPIYIKLTYAQDTTPAYGSVTSSASYKDSITTTGQTINVFMTNFTYDVTKRKIGSTSTNSALANSASGYDLVDLKIEFTEI